MRYLFLIASALWLVARAVADVVRRRGHRVRQYVIRPAPVAAVDAGPSPLVLPSSLTGRPAPPLPDRPVLPWETEPAPEPVDVMRTDRSRLGMAVLIDLSQQRQERRPGGRHRAAVAA